MPGGIRPRLARLTDPDMKRFVSDAVKEASDPAGKKLMADLNKHWANALKAQKDYDKLVAIAEKGMKDMSARASDLVESDFREMQALINFANKELRPIAASVKSFENTEAALVRKYPSLKPAKAVAAA